MPIRAFPQETIHSLAHLATLSDAPGLPLFVSPRTLYVLQNLAALDATFSSRYAKEIGNDFYIPVQEDDAEWDLYQSVVDGIGLEVLEMLDWTWWNLPIITQAGIGCTIDPTGSRYLKVGKLIFVNLQATVATGAGQAGLIELAGLETEMIPAQHGYRSVGAALAYDASSGAWKPAIAAYFQGSATFAFAAGEGQFWGLSPAWELAVNDLLTCSLCYEAAA